MPTLPANVSQKGQVVLQFQDEGVDLPVRSRVNVKGTGVRAIDNPDADATDLEIAAGGGTVDMTYGCPSGAALGDAVYISAAAQVALAFAGAGGHGADAVIVEKPTTTTAKVIRGGSTPAVYAGLTPSKRYFLSATTAGKLVPEESEPTAAGTLSQRLAVAEATDRQFVSIDPVTQN